MIQKQQLSQREIYEIMEHQRRINDILAGQKSRETNYSLIERAVRWVFMMTVEKPIERLVKTTLDWFDKRLRGPKQ